MVKVKVKQSRYRPGVAQTVSRKLRFPDFMTTAQKVGKVVSLTHRPHLPQEILLVLIFVRGHSGIGRIMSMKHSNYTIWDRTSVLPICTTAP